MHAYCVHHDTFAIHDQNVLPSSYLSKPLALVVLGRPSAVFCPHDWSRSQDCGALQSAPSTRLLYTNDINVYAGNDTLQTLDSKRYHHR